MSYDEFKEFYKENKDLDNTEYYAKFPDTHNSTVRSWKFRAIQESTPAPEVGASKDDYDELEKEHIQSLFTQLKEPEKAKKELDGLDNKSKIMVLKNRVKAQSEDKGRQQPNGSILPAPTPQSQNRKKYGIDDYIEFDDKKGEIRVEIPLGTLFDPKENKGLGLLK